MESWTVKHFPDSFDTVFSNKSVTDKLKLMINHPIHSNFILRGPHGSGKKTLLKLFLSCVDPLLKNTFFLSCSNTKNCDIKASLYLFIDKKIDNSTFKYIVIKKLERFPSQFYHILYNLFSNSNIIVIILETKEFIKLETWCIIFTLHAKTTDDLLSIGKHIFDKENFNIDSQDLLDIVLRSRFETYTFIMMLQSYYYNIHSWLEFTRHTIDYEFILYNPSLKKRLVMIKSIETQGYSLEDIAINLYSHVYERVDVLDKLPIIVELGSAIEKYANCEYRHDYLIYAISTIWKQQNSQVFL